MRSISIKLLLAFVLVSLMGTALLFGLARWSSNQEIQNYYFDQVSAEVIPALEEYYRGSGSWEGLAWIWPVIWEEIGQGKGAGGNFVTVVDLSGRVVLESMGFHLGEFAPADAIAGGTAIMVDGEQVGTAIFPGPPLRDEFQRRDPFIDRINRALQYSAIGAAAIALIFGFFLSRTFSRPILDLTAAAKVAAKGDLTWRVEVRSKDELGELAKAFNQMISDLDRQIGSRRQMTADIAHELRTPISIILGHADAISEGVLAPSRETFEVIRGEAERLERMVKDLRTLSMADVGELPLEFVEIEPAKLAADVVESSANLALEKQIELRTDVDAGTPVFMGDVDRLMQVFRNVLNNAIHFTPQGGTIRMSAEGTDTGEGVLFKITDGGPGVDAEALDRIFDRFYRVDAARQRDTDGSGLGLAIARSIVTQHGGKIWAECAPGEGLTILVALPLRQGVEGEG